MAKEYPTSVHLSRGLKLLLRQAAKQERRSVSAQIRFILDEWAQKRRPDPTTAEPPAPPAAGEPEQPEFTPKPLQENV